MSLKKLAKIDQTNLFHPITNLKSHAEDEDILILDKGDGVYVYERKYNDKSVVVILSGSDSEKTIDLDFYREVLPKDQARDVISENHVNLGGKSLTIAPRSVLLLEFWLLL